MKINCQRCSSSNVFEIPDFSIDDKKKLLELNQVSALLVVKEIIKLYSVTHRDAKFIASHMNLKYKSCHRCHKTIDNNENSTCSNCNSLNLNWNVNS
ncbi:hypothetical protein [uncultured Kordia sp.]|uniref:hypothetical protein n=1 Tax=uncultured Kordia sp. TaxID=507699 RepID=UPI00260FE44A|nr:hypothetical protein [uncultured Kordia sp.]